MDHFPIFLSTAGRRIVVSGGGDAAEAKLRLLLKTQAKLTVFAPTASATIENWAQSGRIALVKRAFEPGDALCAALFYAANEDHVEDQRVSALARADGALVNVVDNLQACQFITPAIVDRDPVTVAIGTEGAAPVLARAIKADVEAKLSPLLGALARVGKRFRIAVEALPAGRARRDFWRDFYFRAGPRLSHASDEEIRSELQKTLHAHQTKSHAGGHVAFVGAGPGDPELLTLKARKALDEADVVIHDRLVSAEILELCRREAKLIDVGKEGFGPSVSQDQINALLVEHAQDGAQVVRLKGGDATVFGRLDEEIEALADAADVTWHIIPGITSASAAVASIGQSLTRRTRNTSVRFMTGHDMRGFADHDWKALAAPGQVAAIYMGKRAARYIQGRLLMHGASPDTPITLVENASRPDQRVLATTLSSLEPSLSEAQLSGPALTLFGLAPRDATHSLIAAHPQPETQEAL